MQHGKLRTDRCPWFIDWLFQATPTSPASLPQEAVIPTLRPASTRSESTSSWAWRDPSPEPTETENPNKNDDDEEKDNLEDDSVPEHRDASSSSHEFTFRAASKNGIG